MHRCCLGFFFIFDKEKSEEGIDGRGLPRDDAFAYAWWCLATDRDPAGGQAGYPYAARLTAAHVALAGQLAADWRRRTSDLPEEPAL